MIDKLIVTVALTGAEVSRAQQPALPICPDDIAAAAEACHAAGAAMVHIHARRPDGTPTQDPAVYAEIIEKIRARCDLIVQVSTGGALGMSAAERLQVVELAPEMATLSMGSVNFGDGVFLNPPAEIEAFLAAMQQHGVKPEFEIFDAGMLHTLKRWVARGRVNQPHVDFVLGVPGALAGTPEALMFLRSQLPEGASWSVAGIGATQLPLTALAIVLGGHVRVGFEDNIYYRKGQLARSNAEFVDRVVRLAHELERPLATPDEARALLGLQRP